MVQMLLVFLSTKIQIILIRKALAEKNCNFSGNYTLLW